MEYPQHETIDGLLLSLQDNHISNIVWDDTDRMIGPRCLFVWTFNNLEQIDNCA